MRRALGAWERFWFAPASTATLAVLRICVGALALVSALLLWPDVEPFYWATWLDVGGARALVVAQAIAAAFLIAGLWTRLASLVVLLCLVLLASANPLILNSGDALLRHLTLVVLLAPAGAALSIDCLRRGGSAWRFPERAVWPLRLVQIQVVVMYTAAVVHKLGGDTWREGIAASYPLRIPNMVRFELPELLTDSALFAHVLTWGTLAIEAAVPIGVCIAALRPWALGLGVLLHVSIDLTLRTGPFSWIVLAAYLAFVPPATMERVLERVRSAARATGRLAAVPRRQLRPPSELEGAWPR